MFLLLLCEVLVLSTRCRINDGFCEARPADCIYIPWCYLSHNTTTDMMVSFKLCVIETAIALSHVYTTIDKKYVELLLSYLKRRAVGILLFS